MSNRYYITGVRKSKGVYTQEGKYADEVAALVKLVDLGDDPDCLLAEVQRWPIASMDDASPENLLFVAQAERINSQWRRVDGEVRCRTIGGEAEAILRNSRKI